MTREVMIYGVVGTQNTGKTTFIKDVVDSTSDRREWFRFTNSGVDYRDKITKMGLVINRNGNEECQKVIFDTLTDNLLMNVRSPKSSRVILDRTPLDAFVYTKWHDEYGNHSVSRDTIVKMWRSLERSMRCLDRIVWIPLSMCDNVKVVDDKFRDTDVEYRRQIDGLFGRYLHLLSSQGMKVTMVYGSRDERVRAFLEYENLDASEYN